MTELWRRNPDCHHEEPIGPQCFFRVAPSALLIEDTNEAANAGAAAICHEKVDGYYCGACLATAHWMLAAIRAAAEGRET